MGYKFKTKRSPNRTNNPSAKWHRAMFYRRSNSDSNYDHTHQVDYDRAQEVNFDVDQHLNDRNNYKLNKKKLLPYEIQKFKEMGKPDPTQNYLEIFLPEMIDDLFTALNYGSNNYKKADYIISELKPYGFFEVGEGTNILVLGHPSYPGVVYKIALDSNGIADNFNDELLQRTVPHYTRVFARHSTGIVSVQEYSVTMTKERMKDFAPQIMELLKELSKTYLVADLSPSRFLNFGVTRQGDFVIQDGSDLFPIAQLDHKIRCQNPVGWNNKKKEMILCGGKLEYSADFLVMRCKECGREINPLELRPKTKEVEANMAHYMNTGMSVEERMEMEQEEIRAIRSMIKDSDVSVEVRESDDDEDDIKTTEVPETASDPILEDSDDSEDTLEEPDEEVTESDDEYTPASDEEDDEEEEIPKIEEVHPVTIQYADADDPVALTTIKQQIEQEEVEHPPVVNETTMPELNTSVNDRSTLREEIRTSLSDKLKQMNMAREEEYPDRIEFSIIPSNPDNDEQDNAGIYLNIHGDFAKAWEKFGLPIFVSFDDNKTQELALNSTTMLNLLSRIIESIQETDE